MIKALEKQLGDERSVRAEYERTNAEAKKHVADVESRYRAELAKATEQLEETKKQLRDEYEHLESSYVSLLADKEVIKHIKRERMKFSILLLQCLTNFSKLQREMNAAINKSSKEREEMMTQLTKQQMKSLAALKTQLVCFFVSFFFLFILFIFILLCSF